MKRFLIALVLGVFSSSANAALINRGGGLIYDSDQNITWLQDADKALTSINGGMTWEEGLAWADGLVILGFDDWRLPATIQPDLSCSQQLTGGVSKGTGCMGSEMGHLFYVDNVTTVTQLPFFNVQSDAYWSGTAFDDHFKWNFSFGTGFQDFLGKGNTRSVSAVRSGDVGAQVPIPAAAWLFGSALGLLGWMQRKAA